MRVVCYGRCACGLLHNFYYKKKNYKRGQFSPPWVHDEPKLWSNDFTAYMTNKPQKQNALINK